MSDNPFSVNEAIGVVEAMLDELGAKPTLRRVYRLSNKKLAARWVNRHVDQASIVISLLSAEEASGFRDRVRPDLIHAHTYVRYVSAGGVKS